MSPLPDVGSGSGASPGTVVVRPPFLVEAARGASAAVSVALQVHEDLTAAPVGGGTWGHAADAFDRFRSAYLEELSRIRADGTALGSAVDSAVLAYAVTDARAAGLRAGP
jgi:hypothetical protein